MAELLEPCGPQMRLPAQEGSVMKSISSIEQQRHRDGAGLVYVLVLLQLAK